MDIKGAKALKERLEANGEVERRPARVDADLPEDAPPVYQWLGVSQPPPDASGGAGDDEEPAAAASLFRRLGFSSG